MKQPSYAVEFRLMDPLKLASTGSVEQSTAVLITGLVRGKLDDIEGLSARDASRLFNRNLARLTRFKKHRKQILEIAEGCCYTFYYCSRCGRRFRSNHECQKCGIPFTLASQMESVVGGMPGIPAKVVAYATQQLKHKFATTPPRA
jgi:hypothetical protein